MTQWRANLGVLAAAILLTAGPVMAGQAAGAPAARPGAGADQAAGAEAHFELGELYHRQVFEALDLAIKEYEEAIRLQPDFAQGHYNLALAYHSKAKLGGEDKQLYRQALQQYKLYLQHSPNGALAAKAKQNIAAVEALLADQRPAKATKRPRPAKRS